MEQLKEYIKNILGVEVKIDPMPKVKLSGLPLAFSESFKFFYATLFDIEVLFLYVREDFTTDKLRRQFEIIARAMNRRCIAVIDTVESYTRARLIEKKIQFKIIKTKLVTDQKIHNLRVWIRFNYLYNLP